MPNPLAAVAPVMDSGKAPTGGLPAVKKALIIINPISGKGNPRMHERIVKAIHKYFTQAGIHFEIKFWDHPDRIGALIDHAREGEFDTVVAAGGDGTINEIARRLVGTSIALGVIPLGSGNGFARHLGYSTRPARAVKQIATAVMVNADCGVFGDFTFMNNAGIGIDAEVAKRYSRAGSRGIRTYVRMGVRAYLSFSSFDCRLEVDGVLHELSNLMLLDISNGTQWGGGAKIAPTSTITDGFLEAVYIEKMPVIELPRMMGMLFDGTLHRHPRVKTIKGKKFRIERMRPGNAHVDGEAVKLSKVIECEIKQQSLRLLVPDKRLSAEV